MTLSERLEIARKFLLILGPLLVVGWTLWEFTTSAKIEARKPFLEQQTALCFEATRTTAIMATATDWAHWKAAKNRFLELYWGELIIIENPAVATAMSDFKKALNTLEGTTQLPLTALKSLVPSKPPPAFSALAQALAENCRRLIAKSWESGLEPLIRLESDE